MLFRPSYTPAPPLAPYSQAPSPYARDQAHPLSTNIRRCSINKQTEEGFVNGHKYTVYFALLS